MLLRKSIPYIKICRDISASVRNNKEIAQKLPLSVPLPMENNSKSIEKGCPPMGRNSRVTRLPNGLKVCTEDTYGDFVTVGVAIESGCRYENGFPFGISRIVEKLAYNVGF